MTGKLVLGLAGHPGTGKSTLASYLEAAHGFKVFEGSSVIRAHALSENKLLNKREDYDQHHRNMQKVLGLTCLTDTILADPANRLLQVGLRARPNFNRIKEAGGIVVGLTCPIELCLPRIDQTNPKNPKTYQEYAKALAIEASSDAYGTHTSWCIENADYTLDTAKPIEETHSEIDRIISHYDG